MAEDLAPETQPLNVASDRDEGPPQNAWKLGGRVSKAIITVIALTLVAGHMPTGQSPARAAVQDTIEEAKDCQASKTYYQTREYCNKGKSKLLADCAGDRDCQNSAYEFGSNCEMYASICRSQMAKGCDTSSKYCRLTPVAHSCRYNATLEKGRRMAKCDSYSKEAKSKCPKNKKTLICIKWATHLHNLCMRSAEKCKSKMMNSRVCKAKTPMKDMSECKEYRNPKVVPLKPGSPVKLADGGTYKFLSANGCQWGGRYCLKGIGISRREPRLVKHDVHVFAMRLEKTDKANEFFISNGHGKCKKGGSRCYPLSASSKACPESKWDSNYTDCVKAQVKRGKKFPFSFTPVKGLPDQFVIRAKKDCPGGKDCDWQLATNEENCWNKQPALVVEKLTFDYAWKLVPA